MRPESATAKKQATRQSYIDTTLRLIRRHGVNQLSMRKVATEMSVTPMALYKHFANKEELLSSTLDVFIAQANVLPDMNFPWNEWVTHVANRMYQALADEPSWIPHLGAFFLGPEALNVTTTFIQKLTDSGFNQTQASQAFLSVIQLTIGAASMQIPSKLNLPLPDASDLDSIPQAIIQEFSGNRMEAGLALLITALKAERNSSTH